MIKPLFLFLLLSCTLWGADKLPNMVVRIEGEPLLGYKILQQTLASIGLQSDIRRFVSDTSVSEIEMGLMGKKGFDPRRYIELLKERSVTVLASKFENQRWRFDLDMREASADFPLINEDSSSQMQKSIYPYWFDVSEARFITIDAPYDGAWYPEIAVMDAKMQILHSSKQANAQERTSFELPEGSKYLKVSNSQGMHLMKEGLWISAEQNEN